MNRIPSTFQTEDIDNTIN